MLEMMGKNERLQFVLENLDEFCKEQRLAIFRDAYYTADLGFSGVDVDTVVQLFKENNYIPTLPKKLRGKEKITVYRGGTEFGVFYNRALSWTLDFDIANFFANRDPRDVYVRYVVKAEILKEHILDFNNDRNEQEILLNPVFLENIQSVNFKEKEWTNQEKMLALQVLAYQQQA